MEALARQLLAIPWQYRSALRGSDEPLAIIPYNMPVYPGAPRQNQPDRGLLENQSDLLH
jgi:hypothetical protein